MEGALPEGTGELLGIMEEVLALLRRQDNDFSWAGWEDAADAEAELEPVIRPLREGHLPPRYALNFFFLPTGPLQEASISSGWGDEFLALADRFDVAVERAYAPGSSPNVSSSMGGDAAS